jgi:hypothetical protein
MLRVCVTSPGQQNKFQFGQMRIGFLFMSPETDFLEDFFLVTHLRADYDDCDE